MNVAVRRTLDQAAISMAVLCGIHCLITPIVLLALPLLATTFWVNENFHLWMLLFVIPTTTLAVWSGCHRHKDKWVVCCAVVGLAILVSVLVTEHQDRSRANEVLQSQDESEGYDSNSHDLVGGCCSLHPLEPRSSASGDGPLSSAVLLSWPALLNTLGGCFLVAGHVRNFLLCRKDDCSHGEVCSKNK